MLGVGLIKLGVPSRAGVQSGKAGYLPGGSRSPKSGRRKGSRGQPRKGVSVDAHARRLWESERQHSSKGTTGVEAEGRHTRLL